jgi:hypothetical protein
MSFGGGFSSFLLRLLARFLFSGGAFLITDIFKEFYLVLPIHFEFVPVI